MARGLQQIKADIRAAAQSGNRDALAPLVAEFRAATAAAQRSQVNAQEQYDPTEGMSGFEKFHTGMAAGLSNVGRRAGQILTPKSLEAKLGVDDATIANREETDAALRRTGPGMAGALLTEMAVTAPVAGGAGMGLRSALGASRAARGAALATEGAVGGELTSGDATTGALFGLGLGGTVAAARKFARGAKRTPEAQALLDEGMDLTPGQMNPKGVINQMETGAEHVPFIGAGVRQAREGLSDQVLRKRLGDVSGRKIGASENIDDVMESTYDDLRNQYKAFEQLPTVAGDGNKLLAGLQQTINKAPVSDDAIRASSRYLDNRMSGLVNQSRQGQVTVGNLLEMRSDLRSQIRSLRKKPELVASERADVLEAAEQELSKIIDNALLPSEQRAIRALDAKYAQYKPIETAFVQHRTGAPTVRQQLGAVKAGMSPGEYVSNTGPKAGTKRLLQNAISVQQPQATPTGIGYLFPKFGKWVSPLVSLTSGSKFGRRLAQGATKPQKALQRVGNTKTASVLADLLRAYRGGAAGAYSNLEE